MSLVVASILVLGGLIWFQARRIGRLQAQNALLLDLADCAVMDCVLAEARYKVAQERIDDMLGYRRATNEEDPRKTQAYADLLSL
jgi:hypothetical protein